MDFKKIVFLSVFIISIIAVSFVAFAEETPVLNADSATVTSNQQPPAAVQEKNDAQWAWGEVTKLDNQAKTLTIKYLDYDVDSEKELVLVIDDKTTFENIKGLDELKLKDTLSIDYAAQPDNKNIAKNISLEKPDALEPVPAQTTKEEVKPVIEAPVSTVAIQSTIQPETPVAAQAAISPAPAPAAEAAPAVEPVSEPAPEVSGQAQ